MERRRYGCIGGLTAVMVLLAAVQCTCAGVRGHASSGACGMDMDHCAQCPSEKSCTAPDGHKPMSCAHCQQAMTLDQAPVLDVSPSFHAGAMFFSPPLLTWFHINPQVLIRRTLIDWRLPMPGRQRLRLQCALII